MELSQNKDSFNIFNCLKEKKIYFFFSANSRMTVPEGLAKSAEDPLFTFITTDAMVIYTGLYPCKV